MTGRQSGYHHVLEYARTARRNLAEGKPGPAVIAWGHARAHFGFMVALSEDGIETSAAARRLREALNNIGTAIEAAVAARVPVAGWRVAEPVQEILAATLMDERGVTAEEITDISAACAVAILARFRVEERS